MSEKPIHRGKEFFKIRDRVFDNYTTNSLIKLMARKNFVSLDSPISTGKEADVFRATTKDGQYRAVKIFRIETTGFQHMQDYINGDPRFQNVKKSKRGIVKVWTQKEFRNLHDAKQHGIRVPTPYDFENNVLIMDFIEDKKGDPAPLLKHVQPKQPQSIIDFLRQSVIDMWQKAKIVHADLNEFNILMQGDVPVIIDIGQAVSIKHPMAKKFLARDLREIERLAKKYKVTFNYQETLNELIK